MKTTSSRLWITLAAGIAVVAGLVLLLAFLIHKPDASDVTTVTTLSTKSPVTTPATSPISPIPEPSAASPIPTPETQLPYGVTIPQVAPDFSLAQAGGGRFKMSDQLARGPVVLVFFQRVGG